MRHPLRLSLLALALITPACGGDDGGDGGSTTTIEDQATVEQGRMTGQSNSALTALPDGVDASSAQAPISQVGQAIQALAARHQQWKAMSAAGAAQQGLVGQLEQAQSAETGEVSYVDGHLQANIVWSSANADIHYRVDLQISPIETGGYTLDGTFGLAFSASTAGYDISYDYDAQYDALTLDATGCPIAGTLTLDYAVELGGDLFNQLPPEARAQVEAQNAGGGRIQAEYGEACGDVVVAGR